MTVAVAASCDAQKACAAPKEFEGKIIYRDTTHGSSIKAKGRLVYDGGRHLSLGPVVLYLRQLTVE